MERRAAGALLALAACIACSAAAPTASNHTALDLYEGASEGCYYNFQHYGEGDRIMTNEPCLNCTCHNRMLMCYLRVCPFTKPIGQDCTVEKRADQCCPIVTCPDVPVDLLTSTSTTSPAEYGATGLGKLDKYGCSIKGKYFPEGSKVPPTPNKPCEHCYCIRNMTTCVMQECTLHVDGCTPIYHKDVCCPVRYSCDHPEDELPLLDDMSTTVRPTPGFLLTTTTVSPVTQMTQDCVHNDQIIADGASIATEKACEHCYCMKGDIVCVVQECGAPMENEGKNCTSMPPREGQCCPDTYICEGDELSTELIPEPTTDSLLEKLTTLSPPRRGGVEGSGYRNEINEAYTEIPTVETELEGSGEEDAHEFASPGTPSDNDEITPTLEDGHQYIPVTTKTPISEGPETATKESDVNVIFDDHLEKETAEPQSYYPSTQETLEVVDETTEVSKDEHLKPYDHVTITDTSVQEITGNVPTEAGESLNTVPDITPDEPYEFISSTTKPLIITHSETTMPPERDTKHDFTNKPDLQLEPEYFTTSPDDFNKIERGTTDKSFVAPDLETETETSGLESDVSDTTNAPTIEEKEPEPGEIKPQENIPVTTGNPAEEKLTTTPDHAQNTVVVAEEESHYPHVVSSEDSQKTTVPAFEGTVTEKVTKEDAFEPQEHISTSVHTLEESEFTTAEPDKGLNTIPSELHEETSSESSLVDSRRTTASIQVKSTEQTFLIDTTEPQDVDITAAIVTESSSQLSDGHVTKGDQYSITTEPSFRKEDETSVSIDKPKEESGSTTIKDEFRDEGLIPTSTHDEKEDTSADVSSVDEDMTTLAPEFNKESDETVQSHPPTTESIPAATVASESVPEVEEETTHEYQVGLASSTTTEKAFDTTLVTSDTDSHEEPSRIPGEGDCLLNGVTYRNNTVVPSINNCHTGCKCVSSIVKCDPIICSPPPDYMSNCQSIYDTPDSCCPTYVCDHPREPVLPQSDNQMSGTESPLPTPTIECRGDQCELSEPTKHPVESTELCLSGNCLSSTDKKDGTSECGPEGCGGTVNEPISSLPVDKPSCANGVCEPSKPSHDQESPIKTCEGDNCKETPSPQTVPCEGDSCQTNIDCKSGDCGPNVGLPQQISPQEPCQKEGGCMPQEKPLVECTGDQPCRRKEAPVAEESPSQCEGSNCVQNIGTSGPQDIHHLNTVTSTPEQTSEAAPEKIETVEEVMPTQPTDSKVPEQELIETTTITQSISEKDLIPTDHTIYETTNTEINTDIVPEKIFETVSIPTEEPTSVDGGTSIPGSTETVEIEKPDEETFKNPVNVNEIVTIHPVIYEQEEETHAPNQIDQEHTDRPSLSGEEGTKVPDFIEDHTHKSPLGEGEGIYIPVIQDKYTPRPILDEQEGTKIIYESTDEPGFTEQEIIKIPGLENIYTEKPKLDVEEGTVSPNDVKEATDKPAFIDEEINNKEPGVLGEHTVQPAFTEEEATKLPEIEEEHTEKLELDEGADNTKEPDIIDIKTNKPTLSEEESTKTPDIMKQNTDTLAQGQEESTKSPDVVGDYTDKPVLDDEKDLKIPDVEQEHTNKPTMDLDDGAKVSDELDKPTSKPAFGVEASNEPHDVQEHTDKPTLNEEVTEISDTEQEHTDKPTMSVEEGTIVPDVEKEQTDKINLGGEEYIMKPDDVKEHTDKPVLGEDEDTKIPDVVKELTDATTVGEEDVTKIYDTKEEYTEKPDVSDTEDLEIPEVVKEHTDKPVLSEDGSTTPAFIQEHTNKPAYGEEDKPIPEVEKEHIPAHETGEEAKLPTEEELTDEISGEKEATKLPVDESTHKPTILVEEVTRVPDTTEEEHTMKSVEVEDTTIETSDAVTEKTISGSDEMKQKPILVEEDLPEKTQDVEEVSEQKPTPAKIDPAVSEGEVTENPESMIDNATIKPALGDQGTMDSAEFEDGTEKPFIDSEEGSKDKPVMIEQETEEPSIQIEQEHTEKAESQTNAPEPATTEQHELAPVEEGSGSEVPDMHVSEPEKDTTLPETTVKEHIEVTDGELEKTTMVPIHQVPIVVTGDDHTESYLVSPSEDSSESPDIKSPGSAVTVPHESGSVLPDIYDSTTESHIEQAETTKIPLSVTQTEETLPPLIDQEAPYAHVKPSTNADENTQTPELIASTESVIKLTESQAITEQGEIYTDIPKQESSVTKSPDKGFIEPQDGEQPKPDLTASSQVDEESTTKVFREDIQPTTLEAHVSEADLTYEGTTTQPESEVDRGTVVPEVIKDEIQTTSPHDVTIGEIATQAPFSEQTIKTGPSDVFTPEREELMTSTLSSEITTKEEGITEIKDSSLIGETETATEYGESPEQFKPSGTQKIDEVSETFTSSPKKPELPDEINTEGQEVYTEAPDLEETKPDVFMSHGPDTSTTEIPDTTQGIPEYHSTPITGELIPEISEAHKETESSVTELPESEITKSQETTTVKDITYTSPEEFEDNRRKIPATTEQEITKIPETYNTVTVKSEEMTTEPSLPYTEHHLIEDQTIDLKPEKPEITDITTPVVEMPGKPDITDVAPEVQKSPEEHITTTGNMYTELPPTQVATEPSLSLVTEHQEDINTAEDSDTETDLKQTPQEVKPESQEPNKNAGVTASLPEITTTKQKDDFTKTADHTSSETEFSETTPYLIELEEHTHKIVEDISTISSSEEEDHTYKSIDESPTPLPSVEDHTFKTIQDVTTPSSPEEEHTIKTDEPLTTPSYPIEGYTYKVPEDTSSVSFTVEEPTTPRLSDGAQDYGIATEKLPVQEIDTVTTQAEITSGLTESSTISGPVYQSTFKAPEEISDKLSESPDSNKPPQEETTTTIRYDLNHKDLTTSIPQDSEETTSSILTDTEKIAISESNIAVPTEKESPATEQPPPLHIDITSHKTTVLEDEIVPTTKPTTTVKQEEIMTPVSEDKYSKPEEKPISEVLPPSTTAEVPKPPSEMHPTDDLPTTEEDGHFPPSATGYGEPDYIDEDQAFGPGTCRYGGKVYVSAQQIPRDDPCDFCFCFRSDIICLQQSCPPPIHGCHEEPIQGFCCPRYECPVSMATTVNVTTTTTTTTTTLPPHFPTHSYKGAAQRRGCQIKGHTYKVGEVVRSSSGPCLHCTCGGDGQMKCDPKACTPEPMLRQMIAAAVSAKRRR